MTKSLALQLLAVATDPAALANVSRCEVTARTCNRLNRPPARSHEDSGSVNPSLLVQLAAVIKWPDLLVGMNQTGEFIDAAIKHNGLAIQAFKNPSEDQKLAAVRQNGLAIQFIANPSEDVQYDAIRQNPAAIDFIQNPSVDMRCMAVLAA